MSEKSPIADLAKDYTRAWAEVQNVVKNAHNPHHKSDYADLSAVIDTVKGVFARHHLALLQTPGLVVEVGGILCQELVGLLVHESGQTINMKMMLPLGTVQRGEPEPTGPDAWKAKKKGGDINAQKAGGVLTYARRYQMAAVAGIAQVDDDGNQASGYQPTEEAAFDRTDLAARIKAAPDMETLNGKGTGKSLEKSPLRLEIEATGDKALTDLFVARREEMKASEQPAEKPKKTKTKKAEGAE